MVPMATAGPLRCLSRPATTRLAAGLLPAAATAPFSTTAISLAAPIKAKKPGAFSAKKAGFRVQLASGAIKNKKSKAATRQRRPAEGARKAFRKRIQLSNNNALPVEGLEDVSKGTMADEGASGRMYGLPADLIDSLRAVEAFKATQYWGLFRRPHMLVRDQTVQLARKMRAAAGDNKEVLRIVLTGDRNTGKSVLLLQALADALLNDWVVIHIPEAQDLVSAQTEYSPLQGTEPLKFSQPTYILRLLQTMAKANPQLRNLKLATDGHKALSVHLPPDASLADLAANVRDQDVAWPALRLLWDELTKVPGRPPVLFSLDGLSHAMGFSAYRDPAFNPVHAHDLVVLGLFADALAGKEKMVNGGAVIGALTRGNCPKNVSVDLAVARAEARAAEQKTLPERDAWQKGYDDRVLETLMDVQALRVSGISREEARAVMEYWASSGVLRTQVNEANVADRWTLGGNGVYGELERMSLLNMRT